MDEPATGRGYTVTENETKQRCPGFVFTDECKPWSATVPVGGRKYCEPCSRAMYRVIADSVQKSVQA
jgi:hypothetical protein